MTAEHSRNRRRPRPSRINTRVIPPGSRILIETPNGEVIDLAATSDRLTSLARDGHIGNVVRIQDYKKEEAVRQEELKLMQGKALNLNYECNPNPDSLRQYWDKLYTVMTGEELWIPPFPDSAENLRAHERAGDRAIYVPYGLHELASSLAPGGLRFSGTRWEYGEGYTGWAYASRINSKHYDRTTEEQARFLMKRQERLPVSIPIATIVALDYSVSTSGYREGRRTPLMRVLGTETTAGGTAVQFESRGKNCIVTSLRPEFKAGALSFTPIPQR